MKFFLLLPHMSHHPFMQLYLLQKTFPSHLILSQGFPISFLKYTKICYATPTPSIHLVIKLPIPRCFWIIFKKISGGTTTILFTCFFFNSQLQSTTNTPSSAYYEFLWKMKSPFFNSLSWKKKYIPYMCIMQYNIHYLLTEYRLS